MEVSIGTSDVIGAHGECKDIGLGVLNEGDIDLGRDLALAVDRLVLDVQRLALADGGSACQKT
jgi:hypothetical protein